MWESASDDDLHRYFGYKGMILCPTCNLILGDVEELRREHRNAGDFSVAKKVLFNRRK